MATEKRPTRQTCLRLRTMATVMICTTLGLAPRTLTWRTLCLATDTRAVLRTIGHQRVACTGRRQSNLHLHHGLPMRAPSRIVAIRRDPDWLPRPSAMRQGLLPIMRYWAAMAVRAWAIRKTCVVTDTAQALHLGGYRTVEISIHPRIRISIELATVTMVPTLSLRVITKQLRRTGKSTSSERGQRQRDLGPTGKDRKNRRDPLRMQ